MLLDVLVNFFVKSGTKLERIKAQLLQTRINVCMHLLEVAGFFTLPDFYVVMECVRVYIYLYFFFLFSSQPINFT